MLANAIASVRTVITLVVLAAYTLLAGPPGLLIAIAFRWPLILFWLGCQGARLGCFLVGIRIVAEGHEQVDPRRAAVYCVNHASHLEPPVVFQLLRPLFPRLLGIYKKEIRKVPIFGKALEVGEFIPIDRRDRTQSDQAIALAAQRLREGYSFLVFPEGTRSRTGELQPFKKGAFILAIAGQAPVVPVAIIGTGQALRRGTWVIRPATVRVCFGEPVPSAGLTYESRDLLMHDVRGRIAAMLGQGGA